MSNPDWWYDPPDEPEDEICDSCDQIMEMVTPHYKINGWRCVNKFCPNKFTVGSVEEKMAEYIVELLDIVSDREWRIKELSNEILTHKGTKV